nr:unnamed protein product [Callosobruchus analis]
MVLIPNLQRNGTALAGKLSLHYRQAAPSTICYQDDIKVHSFERCATPYNNNNIITNASTMMKCDRLDPISSQEPTFVIRYRNCITNRSEKIRIMQKMISTFSLPTALIALNTQQVKMNGIASLNTINAAIVKGLNRVRNARTHIGSKEFTLATLPVPKKPEKYIR